MKYFLFFCFWASTSYGQLINSEYSQLPSSDQKKAEIQWVWKHLHFFVDVCVEDSGNCGLSLEKDILIEIAAYLKTSQSKIRFSDEENLNIEFDLNDQAHRVAITELRKGADVFINTERMRKLDLKSWVSLLVHEAAHHIGLKDDNLGTLDKLGGLVASYFVSRAQITRLADFGHPDSKIVFFLSKSLEFKSILQISSPFLKNVDEPFLSLDMSSLKSLNRCEHGNAVIKNSLKSKGFKFKALKYKNIGDRVQVVGVNAVNFDCVRFNQVVASKKAFLELSFSVNFSNVNGVRHSAVDPVETSLKIYDETSSHLEANSRINVLDVSYPKIFVLPGESVEVVAIVQAPSDVNLKSCAGYYNSQDYSYHAVANRILVHDFEKCEISQISENNFRLKLSFAVGESFQSQKIRLDFLIFLTDSESETAVSYDMKTVEIQNSKPLRPIEFIEYQVPGYPKTKFKNIPFLSSFKIQEEVPFTFQLLYSGQQNILEVLVELEIYAELNISASGFLKVDLSGDGLIFQDFTVKPGIDGHKILNLNMNLPDKYNEVELLGFKIRKIILKTDDSYYYELYVPSRLEYFFFTQRMEDRL